MTKLRLGVHTLRIQTGKYENKVRKAALFSLQKKLHRRREALLPCDCMEYDSLR